MGKFIVELAPLAIRELKAHKKSGNKTSIKKLEKILKELSTTPYEGTGKPEALKYDLTGYWSRRINTKDRLLQGLPGKCHRAYPLCNGAL